ncbi:uncharacterized protein A1O9_00135 [Exophiala aquamarina CBS 119918]|uniref:Major facilitator superfamily (MFS) profile domain-containing protein n=1 Tax=Exophiala aquamarina CBS 119918 TaxID=1182545 RepID=A0A072PS52_9EURO|nr:uncharacterized protein A1O9_00135 [Exophiala aquamarina CBS 119918]KEF62163.1 hypothetical protein A1O9_00135 [Exophiala aquamarina CBS 119918]
MDSDEISNASTEAEIVADETTALLAGSTKLPVASDVDINENGSALPTASDDDDKPLPKGQIFFLCLARVVEPIAFFCIFPFINKMIWDTGEVAKTDVGFYSGLIESMFSLTQMLLMIPWGWAADHFGRRPVLVFSLGGVTIGTALFGLSQSIWQMIVLRCFSGVFAGTIVTIRTMLSENSTPKTQARAFSLFAFTGNLGIFIGPVVGGALADPANQYPKLLGHTKLFEKFPYALPTFATGSLGLIVTVVCAVFVKETLVKTHKSSSATSKEHMSIMRLLGAPNVGITLYIYGHVMVLAFAFTAILPVFYFTPVSLGGFGFSPVQISLFMAIGGLSQSLWLLVVFPWLQVRIGTAGVMKVCGTVYPIFFTFLPLCNIFLRLGWTTLFWSLGPVLLALGSGVAMSFTAIQLVVNDVSPSPAVLGTLNAVALTLVSGLRAFSPALFASLFAMSVRSGVFYGHLIWVLMVLLAAGFAVVSFWTPEPNKQDKVFHSEEQH